VARPPIPLVYVDTAVFLHVIKREAGFWAPSLQVLQAALRGDIRLLLSALVLAELAGVKGDADPVEHDRILDQYLLDNEAITWVDVDVSIATEARQLARRLSLRGGADATHLATAVRHSADFFMSTDKAFPYDTTVDHVRIRRPEVVWQETVDDLLITAEADAEADAEPAGGMDG
jgi:predicted nucleic acid-binding protein